MSLFKRIKLPDRLPQLRGWAMTAYVAIWLALLPVAVAMPLAGSWFRYQQGVGDQTYAYGFDRDNDWRVTEVLGPEAKAAGLRPGDRVVAVNGIGVSNPLSPEQSVAIGNQFKAPDGSAIRLQVTSPGGSAHGIVLHRRSALAELFYRGSGWTAESLSAASALILLIPWFVLLPGAVMLFARRRDPGAALLSLTLLLLTQGPTWANVAWLHWGLLVPYRILSEIGVLGLFGSIITFPRGRFEPRWTVWLGLFILVYDLASTIGQPPPVIDTALGILVIGLILLALAVRYRRETPPERRQWRWALLGVSAGLVLLLVAQLVYAPYLNAHQADRATNMWSWIISPGLISCSVSLMIGGMLLSVLRYRIYAAQSAVSKSLIFGSLTVALLAVFAGTEKVIELIGEEYFGQSLGALAGGLGAAFAAVAIAPLHKRISGWVEQRLRKHLIALRRQLPRELAEQAEREGPEDVAAAALARIAAALHAERGAIIEGGDVLALRGIDAADLARWKAALPEPGPTQTIRRDDPLLPVRLPLGFDGESWLLLGRKPDESLYDKDERAALAEIAEPLGHALRLARRERSLDARLERIEDRLGQLLGPVAKPSAA